MQDYLKLARLYWVLLAVVAGGRWALSLRGMPYATGSPVFSIVTLTVLSALFYGAFLRAWGGQGVVRAITLGAVIGLSAQIVIFASTAISYLAGIESYFNHPVALNVEQAIPMGEALGRRFGGLVVGTVTAAVAAALGWALGWLLPERPRA